MVHGTIPGCRKKKELLHFPLSSYFSVLIALSIGTRSTILMATFFPHQHISVLYVSCTVPDTCCKEHFKKGVQGVASGERADQGPLSMQARLSDWRVNIKRGGQSFEYLSLFPVRPERRKTILPSEGGWANGTHNWGAAEACPWGTFTWATVFWGSFRYRKARTLRMETYLPLRAHDCCVVESPAASLKLPQIKEVREASFDLAKVNAVLRELEPQTIPRCG